MDSRNVRIAAFWLVLGLIAPAGLAAQQEQDTSSRAKAGLQEESAPQREAWIDGVDPGLVREIRDLVERSGDSLPSARPRLERLLARASDRAVPSLCAVLWGTPLNQESATGSRSLLLTARQRTFLVGVLGRMDRVHVEAFLRKVALGEKVPDDARSRTMQVLRDLGRTADLPLLIEIIQAFHPVRLVLPGVGGAFRQALGSILERRGVRSYRALAKAFPDMSIPVRKQVLEVLRSRPCEASLRCLEDLLDSHSPVAADVMRAIRMVADRSPLRVHHATLVKIRSMMEEDDPALVRVAAETAGGLLDMEAVPELIKLLQGDDRRTTSAALRALRRISGKTFGEDPDEWEHWLEDEEEWALNEGADVRRDLLCGESRRIVAALRILAAHPCQRSRYDEELMDLLNSETADVRRTVCTTLMMMGARSVSKALLPLLEDADKGVRLAALSALRRLSGLRLPLDRKAWEEALL